MKRRAILAGLAGVAVAPGGARARRIPLISFVHSAAPEPLTQILAAFRQSLNEAGFVEGQNVRIDYRFAENRYERLPEIVADMVRSGPDVIVTGGASNGPLAAKRATSTIPIVFFIGNDPVTAGLVRASIREAATSPV